MSRLIERDLRFFSSSALAELTPTQLEEWAGASRQAIAQLEAMQAEIDRLTKQLRDCPHCAAIAAYDEAIAFMDQALDNSKEGEK